MNNLTQEPVRHPSRPTFAPRQTVLKRDPAARFRQERSARDSRWIETGEDVHRTHLRSDAAPKIARVSMAPRAIERNPLCYLWRRVAKERPEDLGNSAYRKCRSPLARFSGTAPELPLSCRAGANFVGHLVAC